MSLLHDDRETVRALIRRAQETWCSLAEAAVESDEPAAPLPPGTITAVEHASRILLFRTLILLLRPERGGLPPSWVDRMRRAAQRPRRHRHTLWAGFNRAISRMAPSPADSDSAQNGIFDYSDPTVGAIALSDGAFGRALAPLLGGPDDPLPAALTQLSPEVLGDVYESLIGLELELAPEGTAQHDGAAPRFTIRKHRRRKRAGAFYTPVVVARDLVARGLSGLHDRADQDAWAKVSVFDPAMGSGRFLIEAARQLATLRGGDDTLGDPSLVCAIDEQLTGIETDPFALWITRFLLADLAGAPRQPLLCSGAHLLHGDALMMLAPKPPITSSPGQLHERFDLIVGNPPYGRVRSGAVRDALRGHYPLHRGGFDRYRLFFEAALSSLTPGGRTALLLPSTWLTLAHAKPLRDHILHEMRLREVTRYGWRLFPDATVEVMSVVVERAAPDGRPVLLRHASSAEALAAGNVVTEEASPSSVLGAQHAVTAGEGERHRWGRARAAQLASSLPPLERFVKVVCGLKPYQRGKGHPPQTGIEGQERRFEVPGPFDESCRPLVTGRQIQRYAVDWTPDSWIRYGPWLAEPRRPEVFEGPLKLLGRQTGARLIVAADSERRVARDSTFIVLPPSELAPEEARVRLLWTLAILNDPVATWLFRMSDPDEVDKAFPQVRVTSVRRLPFPDPTSAPPALVSEITGLAAQRVERGEAFALLRRRWLDWLRSELGGLDRSALAGGSLLRRHAIASWQSVDALLRQNARRVERARLDAHLPPLMDAVTRARLAERHRGFESQAHESKTNINALDERLSNRVAAAFGMTAAEVVRAIEDPPSHKRPLRKSPTLA